MCRIPLELSLWNGFPLTISEETHQASRRQIAAQIRFQGVQQGRQPADRYCQIAVKADSIEATGVAMSIHSPCPQGRSNAER